MIKNSFKFLRFNLTLRVSEFPIFTILAYLPTVKRPSAYRHVWWDSFVIELKFLQSGFLLLFELEINNTLGSCRVASFAKCRLHEHVKFLMSTFLVVPSSLKNFSSWLIRVRELSSYFFLLFNVYETFNKFGGTNHLRWAKMKLVFTAFVWVDDGSIWDFINSWFCVVNVD